VRYECCLTERERERERNREREREIEREREREYLYSSCAWCPRAPVHNTSQKYTHEKVRDKCRPERRADIS